MIGPLIPPLLEVAGVSLDTTLSYWPLAGPTTTSGAPRSSC